MNPIVLTGFIILHYYARHYFGAVYGVLPMGHKALKAFSIVLVFCVLSVGGLAQAKSVEHAGHHAHHQAATHGTVLCSWMCDAGTVLDSVVVQVQADHSPVSFVLAPYSVRILSESCRTAPSRAPPSFSL
ncbi:MAG: hypothetical protein OEY86_13845 [Nitrospira sp.]|nr:hypothetical protein [Nitrospira sp.]